VLDEDPAPLPQIKGTQTPAQFSIHVYCGQTVTHISYW